MLSIVSEWFATIALEAVENVPAGPRGYLVLDQLARGEPPSQLALARRLGVDKTTMTYLVDALERAGLVTRRADPADRRARLLAMTAKGRKTLLRARAGIDEAERQLLSVLPATGAASFRDMLERIAGAAHDQAPEVGAMGSAPTR